MLRDPNSASPISSYAKVAHVYAHLAAWLLFTTAVAKVFGLLLGDASFLQRSDPLIPFLSNRVMIMASILVELAAFIVITFNLLESIHQRLLLILWCALVLGTYRVGLLAIHYAGPCKCLGDWWHYLGISQATRDHISRSVLVYLLAPSALLLLLGAFATKRSVP